MEPLAAAVLVVIVVIFVRIRSAKSKPHTKNDAFVTSACEDDSARADTGSNEVLSYEIPIPDTFQYRHRRGPRLSERQRSAKKARRDYDLYMLAERRRQEEEEEREAIREARRIGIRKLRQTNPVGFSNEWVVSLTKEQEGRCFWCGMETRDGDQHLDHVWPLSKGGFHDVANLVLACGRCNLKKGARSPWEMVREDLDPSRQELVWGMLLRMGVGGTPAASRRTPQTEVGHQLTFDWTEVEAEEKSELTSRVVFAEVDGKKVQLTFEFD